MTTVATAALRRADIVCVERPDVDVGAAQMLLEYQDTRARIHMCTHTDVHSSGWPVADVPFSHHTADTQVVPPPPCQPYVSSWLVWPTVMETLQLTVVGSTGRRAAVAA